MSFNAPNHFGYNFELKLNKIPTKCSDRIALSLLFPGLVVALFFIALGLYEIFYGSTPQENVSQLIEPWFNLTFFSIMLILLGLWTLGLLLFNYFTYKKVFFDGKKITMIYRHAFGAKTTVKESLKKYKGVRFRVEFFQFGFLNKSKYIVELYHDDMDKIAPLYISTSGHNIRRIWQFYAEKMNLPEIIMTEQGWDVRDIKNLNKSISQMHQDGFIVDSFNKKQKIPSSVSLVTAKDKTVIKSRQLRWDAFNFMTLFVVVLFFIGLLLNLSQIIYHPTWLAVSLVLGLFAFLVICRLFTRDKLIIKPSKIIIVHKTFFFSRKKNELNKDEIKVIDIAFNPANDRYFLLIIGNNKTLVFGKKLPLADIIWVKQFLIHHIIKK
ncbi:MAG: hypothetical protein IJ660_04215 [Alphaproteobacteria bacterium]|nr:hypothetical protein [Alphaproteobacteria bacterium]